MQNYEKGWNRKRISHKYQGKTRMDGSRPRRESPLASGQASGIESDVVDRVQLCAIAGARYPKASSTTPAMPSAISSS
jgi:hypothetical protein